VLCPPQSPGKPPKRKYRLKRIEVERKARAEAMRARLKEPEMKKLYARRSASVEPVIGVLKNVMGFRRFRLFGLVKSKIELTLVAIAYNLRHLAQMGLANAS
jgi:IS5 family transposase